MSELRIEVTNRDKPTARRVAAHHLFVRPTRQRPAPTPPGTREWCRQQSSSLVLRRPRDRHYGVKEDKCNKLSAAECTLHTCDALHGTSKACGTAQWLPVRIVRSYNSCTFVARADTSYSTNLYGRVAWGCLGVAF